jgi:dienelactone hydrolase
VSLEGFTQSTFTADGKTRDIYTSGSGPAVIVIAEMPGITPKVVEFAHKVTEIGCTAVLPHLFGTPGRKPSVGYVVGSLAPICISKEFRAFATGTTTPVTIWLRALARQAHADCGGPGVGAVGMCFTGGFALGMMVDDVVLAPVLSQPSLPLGAGTKRHADLGISPADLQRVKQRCNDEDICVLGLRFSNDWMAPAERFATLRRELGDKFVGVELDSSKGNPFGHRRGAHSVLTEDLQDRPGTPTRDALDQVLNLFRTKLLTA